MKCCYIFLLFLFPFFGEAQILDSLDIYDHKEFENQTLKVFSDNGLIKLQVIKANIIKVNFYKKAAPEIQEEQKADTSVDVRITQNLDDIFMQTDSLLVIINKLDFKIKFQTTKEQLYTINQSVSLSDSCHSFSLSTTKNEDFFKHKNRKLKQKIYKMKTLKAIYSSKKYALYFQDTYNGYVELNNQNLQIKYYDSNALGYYFLTGSKKEVELSAKLYQKN
ncbi:alpha-glucosidase domain-containing protein [Pedobacter cryophilus]|uniref:DUF4968 domain-containing protein n=1 Tax=Pedobacter cryophilus TaxID=2571271 RepID=A0A4U1C4D9_9SPHI|nr:alpha-glucosidase domain-containing protein [Pedobacter cryophilus]TKC00243.1 DUF4968 domain-containing protein [Pedobacter cryophilus]